jgi:hypothetical protein
VGVQERHPRVGLLWRAEWDPVKSDESIVDTCKLRDVFVAFGAFADRRDALLLLRP